MFDVVSIFCLYYNIFTQEFLDVISINELHRAFTVVTEKFTSGEIDFHQYSHELFLLKSKADVAGIPFKFSPQPIPPAKNDTVDVSGILEMSSLCSEEPESSSSNSTDED